MAGFGLSLLFVAAFILPNACCSGLQIEGSGASSQKLVESADFQGASESPKIVLVSSSGSTTGRFGFVQERNEGREHRPSEAKPSNRESGEAPELPASEMPYSEMPACEHDVCGHAMTYGRPLLSSVELASHLGISGAQTVIQAQPFLSPLGGLFLIIAHILNIRSRVCGRSKCCGAGQ